MVAVISEDRNLAARLIRWFRESRRDMPWRVPPGSKVGSLPDPYHVLVSELMLQQTQVATVIPYFHRFIETFATIGDLAAAEEGRVLRLWQGLGYYSRARNLMKAAKKVVDDFGGVMPRDVETLLTLPGVGRYTAGAIASLAYDTPAPILDGNVARVLCRLDLIETDPRDKPTQAVLWARAEELLPAKHASDFNSAMMELGATICTPRNPRCLFCPVQNRCKAFAAGRQNDVPLKRAAKPTPHVDRWTLCLRRGDAWLMQQRPARGRWAGLWQFVTIAPPATSGTKPKTPRAAFSELLGVKLAALTPLETVSHGLTHRRYTFHPHVTRLGQAIDVKSPGVEWITNTRINDLALSKPQLAILALARLF